MQIWNCGSIYISLIIQKSKNLISVNNTLAIKRDASEGKCQLEKPEQGHMIWILMIAMYKLSANTQHMKYI